jgi:hypothetical protein
MPYGGLISLEGTCADMTRTNGIEPFMSTMPYAPVSTAEQTIEHPLDPCISFGIDEVVADHSVWRPQHSTRRAA